MSQEKHSIPVLTDILPFTVLYVPGLSHGTETKVQGLYQAKPWITLPVATQPVWHLKLNLIPE